MEQAEGGWGEISSAKGLGDADPVEVPFGGCCRGAESCLQHASGIRALRKPDGPTGCFFFVAIGAGRGFWL